MKSILLPFVVIGICSSAEATIPKEPLITIGVEKMEAMKLSEFIFHMYNTEIVIVNSLKMSEVTIKTENMNYDEFIF